MQALEGEEDLRGIEFGLFFWEFILEGEEAEEFSAGAVLEYEVEFILILEALLEFDEEGVLNGGEYFLLCHYVFFLVLLQDVLFLEHLQCVQLVVLQLPH